MAGETKLSDPRLEALAQRLSAVQLRLTEFADRGERAPADLQDELSKIDEKISQLRGENILLVRNRALALWKQKVKPLQSPSSSSSSSPLSVSSDEPLPSFPLPSATSDTATPLSSKAKQILNDYKAIKTYDLAQALRRERGHDQRISAQNRDSLMKQLKEQAGGLSEPERSQVLSQIDTFTPKLPQGSTSELDRIVKEYGNRVATVEQTRNAQDMEANDRYRNDNLESRGGPEQAYLQGAFLYLEAYPPKVTPALTTTSATTTTLVAPSTPEEKIAALTDDETRQYFQSHFSPLISDLQAKLDLVYQINQEINKLSTIQNCDSIHESVIDILESGSSPNNARLKAIHQQLQGVTQGIKIAGASPASSPLNIINEAIAGIESYLGSTTIKRTQGGLNRANFYLNSLRDENVGINFKLALLQALLESGKGTSLQKEVMDKIKPHLPVSATDKKEVMDKIKPHLPVSATDKKEDYAIQLRMLMAEVQKSNMLPPTFTGFTHNARWTATMPMSYLSRDPRDLSEGAVNRSTIANTHLFFQQHVVAPLMKIANGGDKSALDAVISGNEDATTAIQTHINDAIPGRKPVFISKSATTDRDYATLIKGPFADNGISNPAEFVQLVRGCNRSDLETSLRQSQEATTIPELETSLRQSQEARTIPEYEVTRLLNTYDIIAAKTLEIQDMIDKVTTGLTRYLEHSPRDKANPFGFFSSGHSTSGMQRARCYKNLLENPELGFDFKLAVIMAIFKNPKGRELEHQVVSHLNADRGEKSTASDWARKTESMIEEMGSSSTLPAAFKSFDPEKINTADIRLKKGEDNPFHDKVVDKIVDLSNGVNNIGPLTRNTVATTSNAAATTAALISTMPIRKLPTSEEKVPAPTLSH